MKLSAFEKALEPIPEPVYNLQPHQIHREKEKFEAYYRASNRITYILRSAFTVPQIRDWIRDIEQAIRQSADQDGAGRTIRKTQLWTDEEWVKVKSYAADAGQSPSAYIRAAALKKLK